MFKFLANVHYFHLIGLLILFITSGQSNVTTVPNSTRPSKWDFDFQSSNATKLSENEGNFAKGYIDLGGLIVIQSSKFKRVWRAHEGGPDNHGATFYEPSSLPDGYFMLGHYGRGKREFSQHNRVLLVKDDANGAVAKPVNYTLLWSSESLNIKQNGVGYVWEPVSPKGYTALGHIVTIRPEIPSLDKVRCVRSDFVEACSQSERIWGGQSHGVSILKGVSERHVPVGTFTAVQSHQNSTRSVRCLMNLNDINPQIPNITQIRQLIDRNAPVIFFHPDEKYLPSTVDWFFSNGALLYQLGHEANPVPIEPSGTNLPQGGYNDNTFWLDLPVDWGGKERVSRGDLQSAKAYLRVKQVLAGTATDIIFWIFFPYNGQATLNLYFVKIPLGGIGTHVGDWEHVTLRFNNFDGVFQSVYLSRHDKGEWINAGNLEYIDGAHPVIYSSHNGHAMFPHAGYVPQGFKYFGLGNEMARSGYFIATGLNFEIVSVDNMPVVEPPWLNYIRRWGPHIDYGLYGKLMKFKKFLVFKWLKRKFQKLVDKLPTELFWQDGPTGPKLKPCWYGDELV